MAIYSYKASTREGAVLEGAIEAADEKAAAERLKDTGYIPIKIASGERTTRSGLAFGSAKGDVVTFTTELSALLGAGLPLDRSLNILSEISEDNEIKTIILSILKSIREGSSFSDALRKHPKTFPNIYVNMIKAGEAGGVLDVVLDKLNEFLESTKELKEHIFTAMIYPSILLMTGGLSIIVLLTYVLPKFSVIFADLGRSLPVPTQVLLTISSGLKSYWWVFLMTLVAGGLIFRSYLKTDVGRYRWDAIRLKTMRDIITKLETARFCRTLGTLLRSGVPLLQALNNSKDVISNRVMASAIDSVSKGAKEGRGIATPLIEGKVFPALALSMIKVGEETGQMDAMLMKVAETYEKSLRVSIKRFVSLLEPAMILSMGLVIGFIVVSMLMAIFSITDLPF